MDYLGITFSPINPLPPLKHTPVGISPPHVGQFIGHGDTVEVDGYGNEESFVGRVVTVSDPTRSSEFSEICHHPSQEHPSNPHGQFILLQLFTVRDVIAGNEDNPTSWIPVPPSSRPPISGLSEVMSTNCFLWVHPNSVRRIVFIFHLVDAINYTFGPVAERSNTYFIRFHTTYGSEDEHDNYLRTTLDSAQFSTFGANTSNRTRSLVTYTERMAAGLQNESTKNQKLLTKGGAVGYKSQCINDYMCVEFFSYLGSRLNASSVPYENLSHSVTNGASTKELKRTVHPNLDMHSQLVRKDQESYVAPHGKAVRCFPVVINNISGWEERFASLHRMDTGLSFDMIII